MKTIYNKINYCAAIIILLCVMSACGYSEDELTPSGDALTYKLPQGNNDYDQTIVDYYNKYGTYILYKYTDKDAYWTDPIKQILLVYSLFLRTLISNHIGVINFKIPKATIQVRAGK